MRHSRPCASVSSSARAASRRGDVEPVGEIAPAASRRARRRRRGRSAASASATSDAPSGASQRGSGHPRPHNLRNATSSMRWLAPLVSLRLARGRVGRMFSRRLTRLMRRQIERAVASARRVVEVGEFAEKAARIAERRLAQAHEALDVPFLQQLFVGVEEHREVEEIGDERDVAALARQPVGQQHVEPLDDQDVGPVDDDLLARHDVVDEVRIDRRGDIALARLDLGEEADERHAVVALGEALALHQPVALELGVGMEKAVGRQQLHLGRVGPARQHRLQHARRRRFADRHRAGDADDVGHLAVVGAEEALRRLEQPLRRRDIERQQARQRQIDRFDLLERDRIVGRLQLAQIVDGQRQLGVGAQLRPFVAAEMAIGRGERVERIVARDRVRASASPAAERKSFSGLSVTRVATPSRRGRFARCGARVRPSPRRASRRAICSRTSR